MRVKSIRVIVRLTGTDKIGLELEADTPFPEMGYPAHATVEARRGHGVAWALKHFPGVPCESLDAETGARLVHVRAQDGNF